MDKIVTVDGPAASGKTALCRRLSEKLSCWSWLSTGVFYRGLAYMTIDLNLTSQEDWLKCITADYWKVEKSKSHTRFLYKGKDLTSLIYSMEIDQKASDIAKNPEIRKALIPYQRRQKEAHQGLLAEGRDCGTAIFPSAPLKIYLTAEDQIRAERRAKERNEQPDRVMGGQRLRDKQDSERPFNPLRKAQNAWVIQTDQYSLDQIENMVSEKMRVLFKENR